MEAVLACHQVLPRNDWTRWQKDVNNDVLAQVPLTAMFSWMCLPSVDFPTIELAEYDEIWLELFLYIVLEFVASEHVCTYAYLEVRSATDLTRVISFHFQTRDKPLSLRPWIALVASTPVDRPNNQWWRQWWWYSCAWRWSWRRPLLKVMQRFFKISVLGTLTLT